MLTCSLPGNGYFSLPDAAPGKRRVLSGVGIHKDATSVSLVHAQVDRVRQVSNDLVQPAKGRWADMQQKQHFDHAAPCSLQESHHSHGVQEHQRTLHD